ncbi:MAG: TetR/AcrR family transcriptional regulator [Rhodospirillum sp.]|nr:TetR/AcrR family transcriptional regulator [Rhodospirillum sp.]MCF8489277.1 TetR/AcrR family transcriptional regulator [Rhodospirillum sp.]
MPRKASFDRGSALRKAMELFWLKGYHATSLKDLEAKLDLRPGSIYAAFGSKEALFGEALQLYADESRSKFEETLSLARSPLTGLAAHVRKLGCAASAKVPSRACMLVKTLLETPDDDPVLRQTAETLLRKTEAAFSSAFRAAREAGEIAADADPHRLACRLQSDIFGLRAYAQRTDAADRVPGLAEDIARAIEALAVK